jgi:hypothetical protein
MKGNPAKLLADTPSVDGSKSENRSLPERLPVRRIGLEQEFFLVDRSGVLRDLADPYLRRCREAAQAAGFDPRCFKAECVKSLVEISTLPSSGIEEVAKEYLNNLHLALGVASELGLALYPLGTYPLPIRPALRDDPSYAIKATTIGYERFLGAGRCAGTHLHLELPAGTVFRYSRMMASPFAFMRGSAIVMAHDLASTPKTGIQAQLCGDAHLSNFGAYASPERSLLFDLNDFDETLPGPWEWDVKRLAASFVVAGRENGFDVTDCGEAALASVAS